MHVTINFEGGESAFFISENLKRHFSSRHSKGGISMAIFHLSHSFVKRSQGASSVAKAAYNAGQKLEDVNGSSVHSDYTRKGGVLHDEITLPSGSPR